MPLIDICITSVTDCRGSLIILNIPSLYYFTRFKDCDIKGKVFGKISSKDVSIIKVIDRNGKQLRTISIFYIKFVNFSHEI